MEPKVSVIIPVYNNEKYIRKCVESVIGQSYRNLELIIIDDGSMDLSGSILEELAQKDERIVLCRQENHGVSHARNTGVGMATGEYLTFIDGDDYVGEDYIHDFVDCAVTKQVQMVIGGLKMAEPDGSIRSEIIPGDYVRNEKEEWTFRISAVAAHFYKRELWEKYQVVFYEGERGEDMPVSLFFAAVCERIAVLKKAEYYYVQHESSAMHNFKGLRTNCLPYGALEETIRKLKRTGIKNSMEFHELFVLRILATFIHLAKGATKEEIKKLTDYINRILDTYYPNYYKNKRAGLFSGLDIPFFQKVSVKVLIWMKRLRLLFPFLMVVCR